MNCYIFVVKTVFIIFLFTGQICAQRIWFDVLRDNQVRSDFCSAELVRIPTGHNFSVSSGLSIKWYSRLIVWDVNNVVIGDYNTRGDDEIPDLYVGPGVYTLKLELHELIGLAPHFVTTAECEVRIEEKYCLNVSNSFGAGNIFLEGTIYYGVASCIKSIGEGMTVSAIDQPFNGNSYLWSESGNNQSFWAKRKSGYYSYMPIDGATTRTYTYSVQYGDNGASIVANLKRLCSIQVQNNMSGNTDKGEIWINEIPHTSPYSLTVVEGNPLTITASDYDSDGMHYVFNRWEDNSTSPTRTVYPSSHTNYTAYFKGTPIYMSNFRNLSVSNATGENLTLNWTEHPNPLVTSYKIYRKVLKPPLAEEISQIGEVPRGALSFTDYDYYNYGTKYQDMLFYDVDAYCQSENTSSETIWCGVFYGTLIKGSDSTQFSKNHKDEVFENELLNYPNPFNPTTQIRYSLKEGGKVSLQIYDILGNKVADLVNEYKPAGTYFVNFDGADKPTGIYICSIKSNNYAETKKLLLIK